MLPFLPFRRISIRRVAPEFGKIGISEANGRFSVAFPHWPGLSATLEPWQYDTFRTRFSDPAVEPAYSSFSLSPNGAVERITLRAASPVADFSHDYQNLEFRPTAPTACPATD